MDLRRIDQNLTEWMQQNSQVILRLGLGLVFVWFGAPKLFPGLSPAEELVAATVPLDPRWFVPLLGAVEVLIGVCLWVPRSVRIGLALMAGHMLGTVLPLVTLPELVWKSFPVATLEGQYILKNVVLVAAAMVLAGATGRARNARRRRATRDPIRSVGRRRRSETGSRGASPSGVRHVRSRLFETAVRSQSDVRRCG